MTTRLLGLTVRWRTGFDWRFYGALRPAVLGDLVVARAGDLVVGVRRDTGTIAWKTQVDHDGGGGFVLIRIGDVVVTDRRDPRTKRTTLVAVRGDGALAWTTELVANVGMSVARVEGEGEGEVVAAVANEPSPAIIQVDARGTVSAMEVPHPGSLVARAGTTWVVGSSGIAGKHPRLFAVREHGVVVPARPAPQVLQILCDRQAVITIERTGTQARAVGRQATLEPVWELELAGDAGAIDDGRLFAAAGAPARPAPIAVDVASGAACWRAEELGSRIGHLSAQAGLVLISAEGGAYLYTASGVRLGETEGRCGRIEASDDAAFLYVDKALTCLDRG